MAVKVFAGFRKIAWAASAMISGVRDMRITRSPRGGF